jgi:membrane AbrB-like protein
VGLVEGRPPGWLTVAGFTITGAAIGARFSGVEAALLRRHAAAALAVTLLASGIAAGFAALAASVVGIPFTQAWIAFAPGGIEAMAVMALSLGFDPAFVATHHVARLLILFALLPVLMKRLS